MVAGEQGPGLSREQGPWAGAGCSGGAETTGRLTPWGPTLCPSLLSLPLNGFRTAPFTALFLKYQQGSCLPKTHEASALFFLHNTIHQFIDRPVRLLLPQGTSVNKRQCALNTDPFPS